MHAIPASLSEPPRPWQVVGSDLFELALGEVKGKFAIYIDLATKLASCSCFKVYPAGGYHEPSGPDVVAAFLKDWLQHYPTCQWLVSDAGGVFVG
eukprot:5165311-Alexandrium_andersonii.AAC.1